MVSQENFLLQTCTAQVRGVFENTCWSGRYHCSDSKDWFSIISSFSSFFFHVWSCKAVFLASSWGLVFQRFLSLLKILPDPRWIKTKTVRNHSPTFWERSRALLKNSVMVFCVTASEGGSSFQRLFDEKQLCGMFQQNKKTVVSNSPFALAWNRATYLDTHIC